MLVSNRPIKWSNEIPVMVNTIFAKDFDMNKLLKFLSRGRKEVDVGDRPC